MRVCEVNNCTNEHRTGGLCNKHHMRFKRYGDVNYQKYITPGDMNCSYNTAHHRIMYKRGKATYYVCINCQEPATDWAFQYHRAAYTLVEHRENVSSFGLKYSPDPEDYEAMCKSCHKLYDNQQ